MFIVQQKKRRNQSNGEGQQTRRRKKKGRRRSNRRCQCGGNLLHWGLFKSCISSIFPFSFCTGRISLFRSKCPVYSGTVGIVRYRPVSWAVHFEGVSVPAHRSVRRISAVLAGTVRYQHPWLPSFAHPLSNVRLSVMIQFWKMSRMIRRL